jgi:hypothetical protein
MELGYYLSKKYMLGNNTGYLKTSKPNNMTPQDVLKNYRPEVQDFGVGYSEEDMISAMEEYANKKAAINKEQIERDGRYDRMADPEAAPRCKDDDSTVTLKNMTKEQIKRACYAYIYINLDLLAYGIKVFDDAERFINWYTSYVKALDKCPYEAVEEEVRTILGRIEHGILS